MLATIINIVLIVSTSVDYLIAQNGTELLWWLRRITTFLNFAMGPVIPLILLLIFNNKKRTIFLYVPLIINAVLCFGSIFVNIVFFIHTENSYSRGPFFFSSLLTTFFYLSLMLLKPDDVNRQGKKSEQIFMLSIIFLILVSSIMEIKFDYFFITYCTTAIYLGAFYILKNIHYFMIDALTGAYNRQAYNQRLSSITKNYRYVIAFLDINDFKSINDTYGHEEGDKALSLFVDILHRHLKTVATLYRIGGDEFAVISKKIDLSTLKKILDQAELETAKNNLSFAYGIAEYHVSDDIQEVLRCADKDMYINKSVMKKNTQSVSDLK